MPTPAKRLAQVAEDSSMAMMPCPGRPWRGRFRRVVRCSWDVRAAERGGIIAFPPIAPGLEGWAGSGSIWTVRPEQPGRGRRPGRRLRAGLRGSRRVAQPSASTTLLTTNGIPFASNCRDARAALPPRRRGRASSVFGFYGPGCAALIRATSLRLRIKNRPEEARLNQLLRMPGRKMPVWITP